MILGDLYNYTTSGMQNAFTEDTQLVFISSAAAAFRVHIIVEFHEIGSPTVIFFHVLHAEVYITELMLYKQTFICQMREQIL